MAGHSKYKNIMYRKGAQDKKRSSMFSKLSREITVAAKMGMPDPDMNPRLRLAVNAAKAQSMPKDNIQRAIDKAIGGDMENYEEIRYEGFGPGGVSLIIEALTDNRNRTATNVRTAFSKNGGNMAATGAVSHGFERMGMILLWHARPDAENMAVHAEATFWYVLPSLPMFLLIPALLRSGVPFWLALGAGCLLTVALYLAMMAIGPRFGLKL